MGDASAIAITGSMYNTYTAYKLILCGGDHHMPSATWKTVEEATCTENGLCTKECLNCKKVIEQEVLSATGHSPSADWALITSSTCTSNGKQALLCTTCGAEIETKEIPATGHTPAADWALITSPTCTSDGKQAILCTTCGAEIEIKEIPALGHQSEADWERWTEPSCTQNGEEVKRCTVCGTVLEQKTLPALGHQYSDWITVKVPTTDVEGLRTKTCLLCGDKVSEPIARVTYSWLGMLAAFLGGMIFSFVGQYALKKFRMKSLNQQTKPSVSTPSTTDAPHSISQTVDDATFSRSSVPSSRQPQTAKQPQHPLDWERSTPDTNNTISDFSNAAVPGQSVSSPQSEQRRHRRCDKPRE